jgi:hypothetical protein
MSRYRPRYCDNTRTDIRVCPYIAFSDIVSSRHDIVSFFSDIGPDIGNICTDIGTISGHTRSLPNSILPISCPISGFSPISATILGQYRDIPVPCQTRYGFFTDIVPNMVPILQKYWNRISDQKNLDVVPDVYAISQYTDIVYFRYLAFFLISGTIYHLLRLRPPACSTGPASEATAQALQPVHQRGCALGTVYILAHSVLLQKKALVSGNANILKT